MQSGRDKNQCWNLYPPDLCYEDCASCSMSAQLVRPVKPGLFRAKPYDRLVEVVMTGNWSPKLTRVLEMTPQKHAVLMVAALKARKDGADMGDCRQAFKPGTLAQLAAEIALTRNRIVQAEAQPLRLIFLK